MTKNLLVFDFDGVLGMKWTMPETHYPQIPQLIKQLEKNYAERQFIMCRIL